MVLAVDQLLMSSERASEILSLTCTWQAGSCDCSARMHPNYHHIMHHGPMNTQLTASRFQMHHMKISYNTSLPVGLAWGTFPVMSKRGISNLTQTPIISYVCFMKARPSYRFEILLVVGCNAFDTSGASAWPFALSAPSLSLINAKY